VVWRQVALGLAVFAYYLLVDVLNSPERRADADARGEALERFQHWLHIDFELRMNDWLVKHDVLSKIANYEYAFVYILTALATFVWLLWWRTDIYRRARTAFVITTVVAITCFWVVPTTPPRMLTHGLYTDTVTNGHTWGSWGSPLVQGANELAAMPSLHMAWALWVSVVLVWAGVRRWVQLLSAVHVLLTLAVILATANHYLLDAVAAFVLVWAADRIAERIDPSWGPGPVVPSADAFFLHVEGPEGEPQRDAQIVGGLVLWEYAAGHPTLQEMRDLVASELANLPRFTQRVEHRGRWRRARWVPAGPIDWDWHVPEMRVEGRAGVEAAVAQLLTEPFPRDRPLWRIVVFDMGEGRRALLFSVHHAFADGIGTVLQAMRLLRPIVPLPDPPPKPNGAKVVAATAAGFAQLATDGAKKGGLPVAGHRRDFATAGLPLAELKRAARPHRVTDLVLALTAGAVADSHPGFVDSSGGRMRVAVPLMVREPGDAAEGNATAAVMVDVPVSSAPTTELVREIARVTAPLRTPTRALASRWVMAHLLRVFPEPAVGWFARTVYGHRFFDGIVSNMPGPTRQLSMAGVPLAEVYPVLPPAPGAPFVVGGLSWDGVLAVGLATDPDLLDAHEVTRAMTRRLETLLEGLERDAETADRRDAGYSGTVGSVTSE